MSFWESEQIPKVVVRFQGFVLTLHTFSLLRENWYSMKLSALISGKQIAEIVLVSRHQYDTSVHMMNMALWFSILSIKKKVKPFS